MNRGTRINPFEIALWAVAAVLTIGGVAAQTWSVSRLGLGGGPSSEGFVAVQVIYTLGPAVVTAGLIAAAVALALRAATVLAARHVASLATEARRAAASEAPTSSEVSETPSPASGAQQPDPLPFEPQRFRQRQRAVDHSAFKRPAGE